MKINVKSIPDGGEMVRGSEPAAIMEIDEPDLRFEHAIEYDLHAQLQGPALLVTGKLWTPVTLRCSRCLKTFTWPARVDDFVVHRALAGEDFVDLTENLREDIVLALPQRALCQTDCQGLCPVCGKDLNESVCRCNPLRVDLRWHALDRIKLK